MITTLAGIVQRLRDQFLGVGRIQSVVANDVSLTLSIARLTKAAIPVEATGLDCRFHETERGRRAHIGTAPQVANERVEGRMM